MGFNNWPILTMNNFKIQTLQNVQIHYKDALSITAQQNVSSYQYQNH